MPPIKSGISTLAGVDLPRMGIPTMEAYIDKYCTLTGRDGIPDLNYFLAYVLWRYAGIY